MRDVQATIIRDLHVASEVDPAAEIRRRIDFLRDYLAASGARGFVLGISGGQDSALAGRLCQLAADEVTAGGKDAVFVAVRLPYRVQHDEADAQLALGFIQPSRMVSYDIQPGVDGFERAYADSGEGTMTDFTKGNVKARARMIAQYAIAGEDGLLVVGTDHAAEAVTGFYTKHGDGAADLTPLAGLTKRQGAAMMRELGAPERLYLKVPTADLLDDDPGQSDEASLGIRYSDIDDYLEGQSVPDAVADAIERRYLLTEHKRRAPVAPDDTWWR